MSRIVIVEDDDFLREEMEHTFKNLGYEVPSVTDFGPETAPAVLELSPDLVILDINLPGTNGYDLCRWLKSRTTIPVLILTGRDSLKDELHGLDLGADDFLTKPCPPDRLVARVRRLLSTYASMNTLIRAGEIPFDMDICRLSYKDQWMILPETQARLLSVLMAAYPETVTYGQICEKVWGDMTYMDENILSVNIARLRKQLSGLGLRAAVTNVRGKGYRLEVEAVGEEAGKVEKDETI